MLLGLINLMKKQDNTQTTAKMTTNKLKFKKFNNCYFPRLYACS